MIKSVNGWSNRIEELPSSKSAEPKQSKVHQVKEVDPTSKPIRKLPLHKTQFN